ncbi:MAG: peptidoglycan-binding domain-containing protein [Cuspidothrix sp.]
MEDLAYLHLDFAQEHSEITELVSLGSLFKKATAPNWQLFSGKAWKYMLPLALTASILNSVSSVFALEQGSNLNNLQPENGISQIEPTNHKIISTATIAKTTTNKIVPVNNKRKNPNFLVKGDEGPDVRVLQENLRVAGFYHGNPTGVFGPITEEAVKRFQKAYKLKIDGVVGKSTLAKLAPLDSNNGKTTTAKLNNRDTLTLGDRGEAVRILQEQLIKAGFIQSPPNGYYGPNTVDAVTRFQKQHQIDPTGIAGPTTRSKLHNLVKNSSNSDFTTLEIQRRLHEKGFYKGQINGMMAEDTKKAISRAQKFYGISLNDVKNGSF